MGIYNWILSTSVHIILFYKNYKWLVFNWNVSHTGNFEVIVIL